MSYPAVSANTVLLWGRWFTDRTRSGRTDVTITATPLLAVGQAGSGTPNLVDVIDEVEIKTTPWTTSPLASGLWALPLLPTSDTQLGAFGGYRIVEGDEPPYIVTIPENTATIAVNPDMVAAVGRACQLSSAAQLALSAGDTVQALWVRNAAVVPTPPVQPPPGVLTDTQVIDLIADSSTGANDHVLLGWVLAGAYQLVADTRDTHEAPTSGTVRWPDGAGGELHADTVATNPNALGALDAFHVTWVPATGSPKTVTQPAVTRDAAGAITVQPALTIA